MTDPETSRELTLKRELVQDLHEAKELIKEIYFQVGVVAKILQEKNKRLSPVVALIE